MNRKLIIGGGLAVACAAACAAAAKRCDCGEQSSMWEKMRRHMDKMPEDFPPRVMFDNVQAIRANTDEMVTLLRDADRQVEHVGAS